MSPESLLAAEARARKVYRIAREYSRVLSVSQFVVALIGGWLHLLVDGAALIAYVELWNDIRRVYGRGTITKEAAIAYLWPNLSLILGDLLLDKGLGMIPVAGSVFCYWYSRLITFRLSALFGLLAAMQDDMPNDVVLERVSRLVQELYPRKSFLLTLTDPDEDTFVHLLASLEGLDPTQAETRIDAALRVLQGEVEIAEEDDPSSDDDDDDAPAEAAEGVPDYPLVPWRGGAFANLVFDETGEPVSAPVWRALPLLPWHNQEVSDTATNAMADADDDEMVIVVEPDALTQQPLLLTLTAEPAPPSTPPAQPQAASPRTPAKAGKKKLVVKKKAATPKANAKK